VMFLPTKSQIYLPIAAEALSHDTLRRMLRYSLPDGAIDVGAMLGNRRAQNALMRNFCLAHGIRFLDATGALEARVRGGDNVYFPDESHLNETGHAIVASTLSSWLDR